jgi:hypothetical protein
MVIPIEEQTFNHEADESNGRDAHEDIQVKAGRFQEESGEKATL